MKTFALHTDLYQLTMLASYFHQGRHREKAVCEMFVRRLPANRRFLVFAGLDRVLKYLQCLSFTDMQVEALKEIPALRHAMTREFVEYLRGFRFSGNLFAVPEGTVVFENEPFIRVEASLGEAQLIETYLLSTINHATMIASKAARVVLSLQGRPALEFGTRRTHPDAAVDVVRSAYIAGFEASSNVEAFQEFGVPARGTMAHMYIMSSSSEREAFAAYSKTFPNSTYLVDTYSTLEGVRNALETVGQSVQAVRLDSGDLAALSKQVRTLLKDLGREDVKIVLSSDLDEYEIQRLIVEGDFDIAGVGTRLATSDDAPSLGGVYKLVEIEDRPVAKFSESKVTYPGAHQIYRHERDGKFTHDCVGLVKKEGGFETMVAKPLLIQVVQKGLRVHSESLHRMRERCNEQINKLPDHIRVIDKSDSFNRYEVRPTDRLSQLLAELKPRTK